MEESEENRINEINEDFNYDETVEIIDKEKGEVCEGKIVSIRGEKLMVYNKNTKQEETYTREDNIVIKLWEPGRPFQVFNRVDIRLIDSDFWVIGMIIDINEEQEKILIKYTNKEKTKKEEWINIHSERIAQIGSHTSGISSGNLISPDEINKKLFKNRKFIKLNKDQEEKIKNNLEKLSFFIKIMGGDGNCMFRAVSDQIYGNEEYHNIIREKCMKYLLIERKFFSQFIEGGDKEFDNYINMKSKSGVWGDDVELQAISELYNRPIEIYSGSDKPLKTFHENINEFNLKQENKDGEYEEQILKMKMEEKKEKKEEKKEIEESRKLFVQTKDKYLDDMLLDLLLNEDGKNDKSIIEQSKLEYKKEQDDILKKVIKESIDDSKKKEEENKNKNGLNEMDYFSNPTIQSALECGFSLEDAIMAWTIYGDNTDLVMQYLLSNKNYS